MPTEAQKTRVRVTVKEIFTKHKLKRLYRYARLSCGCTANISAAVVPAVGDDRTCRQCTARARGR